MTGPLSRPFKFCLMILFALPLPLSAEWKTLGEVSVVESQGNRIVFRGREASVTVTALAPDLVRVRMTRNASPGPDYSYAVAKAEWPSFPVEFFGNRKGRALRTPELEVRAELYPFRLAFYDRSGQLISSDSAQFGVAWNGAEVRCSKWMPPDEHYFGLGEKGGSLDRRGHAYVMWNTDAYGWDATTDPLYETIPFFIALRQGRAYGIFFDNTYRSTFDLGVETRDDYSFGAEGGEINYYFFYGPDPKKVLARYTELVGRMPLPPRWALGYHQSRYSYYPASRVRFIAENFRERHIPADAIFLDIHYMDAYKIFTWDKSRFPDPQGLITDLRHQGFRVVTIVDPGVKVDPDYGVYQQGIAGDFYVKMPDGNPFVGKVWPGDCVFPDFTSEKVRTWWGSLYNGLVADGVAGIWNDMNEPALFEVPSKTLPLDAIFGDQGLYSPHTKIHNVYGMLMSEATHDGLARLHPNERPLVITRATYAGGQRFAAVWTGDNSSTWDHLRVSLPELMGMGLSGLALAGADIGGFVGSPSAELYTRWLEAGVFYPYCRTHTELASRDQEPWSFGNRLEDANRKSIELRYRLLPYLYDAFEEAAETGLPVMRALLLEYPDDAAAVGQNEEFLFGDDLLVAPVVKDQETEWNVYLPRGVWYDFWSDRRYVGPRSVTVHAPLDRIPLFVRGGAVIPTEQPMEYVDQAPVNPLTFEIYPDGKSFRDYYEDDGISLDYRRGAWLRERISVSEEGGTLTVESTARQGSYSPPARSIVVKIHVVRNQPKKIVLQGKILGSPVNLRVLEQAAEGWFYDEDSDTLRIKIPDRGDAWTARAEFGNRN